MAVLPAASRVAAEIMRVLRAFALRAFHGSLVLLPLPLATSLPSTSSGCAIPGARRRVCGLLAAGLVRRRPIG